MPSDGMDAASDDRQMDDGGVHDLETARTALIAAIDGAEPERANRSAGEPDGLAKVGSKGLSFELRLNGETIPLEGQDVNDLAADDFKPFLDRQKLAVEGGALDDRITQAIAKAGPGKALARVRALADDSTV